MEADYDWNDIYYYRENGHISESGVFLLRAKQIHPERGPLCNTRERTFDLWFYRYALHYRRLS